MDAQTINSVRRYASYGGFFLFFCAATLVTLRGSLRITIHAHCRMLGYWERVFALVYLLSIAFVQVGTFLVKDVFDVHHGPDDAWEMLWGFALLAAAALLVQALLTKQFYLHALYSAFSLVHYFLVVAVANILIRDLFMLHVVPMMFAVIYGCWFLAVVPRPFQIAGHTASMTENDAESFILLHGFSRDYVVMDADEVEDMRRAVRTWTAAARQLLRRPFIRNQ